MTSDRRVHERASGGRDVGDRARVEGAADGATRRRQATARRAAPAHQGRHTGQGRHARHRARRHQTLQERRHCQMRECHTFAYY